MAFTTSLTKRSYQAFYNIIIGAHTSILISDQIVIHFDRQALEIIQKICKFKCLDTTQMKGCADQDIFHSNSFQKSINLVTLVSYKYYPLKSCQVSTFLQCLLKCLCNVSHNSVPQLKEFSTFYIRPYLYEADVFDPILIRG